MDQAHDRRMIPINRYTIGAALAVALIGAAWFGIARWEANIRADVREEVATEQMAEDLAQAQADIAYERSEASKNAQAAAGYTQERVVIYRQTQQAANDIQAEVASGALPNAPINPVKVRTIDAIEELERQRAASEAHR